MFAKNSALHNRTVITLTYLTIRPVNYMLERNLNEFNLTFFDFSQGSKKTLLKGSSQ